MKVLMAVGEIKQKDTGDVTVDLNTVEPNGKRSFTGYAVLDTPQHQAAAWKFGTLYEVEVSERGPFEVAPVAEAPAQTEAVA